MTDVRRAVATVGVALLLVTSGCSLLTQQQTTFSANDVSVSDSARSDAGYSEAQDTTLNQSRNFSVADQQRTVTVVNHVAEYKREIDLGPVGSGELARFTVLSTPTVEIAGQTLNPVGDMSNAELARMLQNEYESIENVQLVENRTQTMLGEETRVSKFSAEARTGAGETVDVYIHVAQVEDGDDFVVALAVHPQELDGEEERVNGLLAGVEHERDTE